MLGRHRRRRGDRHKPGRGRKYQNLTGLNVIGVGDAVELHQLCHVEVVQLGDCEQRVTRFDRVASWLDEDRGSRWRDGRSRCRLNGNLHRLRVATGDKQRDHSAGDADR